MTTFQPGDVVRLTGSEWSRLAEDLVGTEQEIADLDPYYNNHPFFYWGSFRLFIEGKWTAELVTGTLSPQAALDTLMREATMVKALMSGWDVYELAGLELRARKVDGHWQVKSVGGGE